MQRCRGMIEINSHVLLLKKCLCNLLLTSTNEKVVFATSRKQQRKYNMRLTAKMYTTDELIEALGISKGTFKAHKSKYLANYTYEEKKVGRSKVYNITGHNSPMKSAFAKICEEIAGKEVPIPNEENAYKLFYLYMTKDCTILPSEEVGNLVGLERHTVYRYNNLFREYGILPVKLEVTTYEFVDKETGEIITGENDPNEYTYSIMDLQSRKRREISKMKWNDYWQGFYNKANAIFTEVIQKYENPSESRIAVEHEESKNAARRQWYKEFGIANKHFSKRLTDKAVSVFNNYHQQVLRLAN